MRCPMYSQCWWVIVGDFCDFQKHVGRCSGSKQYLYNYTAPYTRWRTIFYHCHLSPWCYMLSSTSWYNMDLSFHEYESVGHKLLQKRNQHSLPPSQKIAPSPTVCQHYLEITFFLKSPPKQNTQPFSIKWLPECWNKGKINDASGTNPEVTDNILHLYWIYSILPNLCR